MKTRGISTHPIQSQSRKTGSLKTPVPVFLTPCTVYPIRKGRLSHRKQPTKSGADDLFQVEERLVIILVITVRNKRVVESPLASGAFAACNSAQQADELGLRGAESSDVVCFVVCV